MFQQQDKALFHFRKTRTGSSSRKRGTSPWLDVDGGQRGLPVQVVAEAGHHHRRGCAMASKISANGPVHLSHRLGYDRAHPQVGPVLGQIAH
jgi:hypothetical protein